MKAKKITLPPPSPPVVMRALAGDLFQQLHESMRGVREVDEDDLIILPCDNGAHIYKHSQTEVGYASATPHGPRVKAVLAIDGAKERQAGEDGLNISIPLEHFPALVEIVKPRLKRHATDEAKARIAKLGAAFRFKKKRPPGDTPDAPGASD